MDFKCRLSVCSIFRNEEDILPQTLPSWMELADELVLFDNDSTDATRQVVVAGLFPERDQKAQDAIVAEWSALSPGNCLELKYNGSKVVRLGIYEPAPLRRFDDAAKALLGAATESWRLRVDADERVEGDFEDFKGFLRACEVLAEEQESLPGSVAPLLLDEAHERPVYLIRCFRWEDGWECCFGVDPVPFGPVDKSHPTPILTLNHLRSAARPESMDRKRRMLVESGARGLAEEDHLRKVREQIEKWG